MVPVIVDPSQGSVAVGAVTVTEQEPVALASVATVGDGFPEQLIKMP